ncbi:MAG: GGDEF domain-containing protein [Solirubrobacteraceae bacterium]|nr:GGDEF domain-containing protein [Solirubrobacteraceae bacterium]
MHRPEKNLSAKSRSGDRITQDVVQYTDPSGQPRAPTLPRRDAPHHHHRPLSLRDPSEGEGELSYLDREAAAKAERREAVDHASIAELRGEVVTLLFFLVAATVLAIQGPWDFEHPWLLGVLTLAFAITSRIGFPIDRAVAIPTQMLLMPLLILGPPALTPILVFLALSLSGLLAATISGGSRKRVLLNGGDALYSLGPATVFVLGGSPGLDVTALLVIAALASQIALDAAASWVAERWRSRGETRFPIRPFVVVWIVDTLLTPIGVAAALGSAVTIWAPLALLPLVALFALAGTERSRRQEEARQQLATVTRERTRLRAAVHRIGDAFASTLDLDALLTITTRAAVEAVDADAARASATTGLGRKMTHRVTIHEDERNTPLLTAVEDRAVNGQSLAHAIVGGVYAMAAPVGDVEAGGVVAVSRNSHEFTAEERQLFGYLCEQASVAARNVARHASLHRQALTDDLTGLANHRRFQELLSDGHDRFLETGTRVGLILLDIDDFKSVNDRYGHQVGDHVLRSVAAALRDTCRATDEPARYGGEELAVVVSDADMHECSRLAERMRRSIEEVEVVGSGGERITVTASFGVALMGEVAKDPAALIAGADAALYRAKYQGKNCVRLADDGPVGVMPQAPSTT